MNTREWRIEKIDLLIHSDSRRWIAHVIDGNGRFRPLWRELDTDVWCQSTPQGIIQIRNKLMVEGLRKAVSGYLAAHETVVVESDKKSFQA